MLFLLFLFYPVTRISWRTVQWQTTLRSEPEPVQQSDDLIGHRNELNHDTMTDAQQEHQANSLPGRQNSEDCQGNLQKVSAGLAIQCSSIWLSSKILHETYMILYVTCLIHLSYVSDPWAPQYWLQDLASRHCRHRGLSCGRLGSHRKLPDLPVLIRVSCHQDDGGGCKE